PRAFPRLAPLALFTRMLPEGNNEGERRGCPPPSEDRRGKPGGSPRRGRRLLAGRLDAGLGLVDPGHLALENAQPAGGRLDDVVIALGRHLAALDRLAVLERQDDR